MSITPDRISAPNFTGIVEASNFKFGTQLGFGTSLPKNNVLDQNWRGSGPGEHPKKLVYNLGLGLAYRKTTLSIKIGRVCARGASKKIWDPLLISPTVEASNFKFGTQFGFGTSLPKNNV